MHDILLVLFSSNLMHHWRLNFSSCMCWVQKGNNQAMGSPCFKQYHTEGDKMNWPGASFILGLLAFSFDQRGSQPNRKVARCSNYHSTCHPASSHRQLVCPPQCFWIYDSDSIQLREVWGRLQNPLGTLALPFWREVLNSALACPLAELIPHLTTDSLRSHSQVWLVSIARIS